MAKRRASGRSARGYHERRLNLQEPRQRFLIVCEGEKTEPNYFLRFRVPTVVVDVRGLGCNPTQLVQVALAQCQQDDYDQAWCVFDRDTWTPADFKGALALAKQRNVKIAYSNEAFELWYLLHFHYYDTGISRQDYQSRLSDLLGYRYAKKSNTMYDALLSRQGEAIRNAERLLSQYDPPNPAADNPSTTVHLLVKELNRFAV